MRQTHDNSRVFFDTNLLVYLFSNDPKSEIVEKLLLEPYLLHISTQVLNELIHVLVYKLRVKSKAEIKELINDLTPVFTVDIVDLITMKKLLMYQ